MNYIKSAVYQKRSNIELQNVLYYADPLFFFYPECDEDADRTYDTAYCGCEHCDGSCEICTRHNQFVNWDSDQGHELETDAQIDEAGAQAAESNDEIPF
jgi:hypothetical protein